MKKSGSKNRITQVARKNHAKTTSPRLLPAKPSNTAKYHFENGTHVFTLELCEGAFAATKAASLVFGRSGKWCTPAEYALACHLDSVASDLTQIGDDEASAVLTRTGIEEAAPATKTITLTLPVNAHTVLAGQAIADGYDSPAHMITHTMADLCAQAQDGCNSKDEKRYLEMFGLIVEPNGNTRLP